MARLAGWIPDHSQDFAEDDGGIATAIVLAAGTKHLTEANQGHSRRAVPFCIDGISRENRRSSGQFCGMPARQQFLHLLPHLLAGKISDRLHVTCSQDKDMSRTPSKSSRDKVRVHREKLRRKGLRPIQIWVPDVRSPKFAAEAHRQSLAVAHSAQGKDDQDFIDSISSWNN